MDSEECLKEVKVLTFMPIEDHDVVLFGTRAEIKLFNLVDYRFKLATETKIESRREVKL